MSQMHSCPICGYEFDIEGMQCHTSCPLSSGCNIICCPNCGYQIPDHNRSRLVNTLKQLWQRYEQSRSPNHPDPGGTQTLAHIAPGQAAEVTEILARDGNRLAKLSAYGIIPGSVVTVRQRNPAYVVAVDETEVALDASVASEIVVRAR